MGKYFIDAGAHTGESIRLFRSQYPSSQDYKIISFEPNQDHRHYFETPEFADVEFHNVAISTVDGTADLYYHDWSVGMTLYKSSYRVHLNKPPMRVPTIDFSKWMLERFTKDDYIIFKCDTEGAEYDVIEKMLAEGSFDLVRKLYIEWHHQSYGVIHPKYDELVRAIHAKGIKDYDWNAGPGRTLIEGKEIE